MIDKKYSIEEIYSLIQKRIRDDTYHPELIIDPNGWRLDMNEKENSGASDYTPDSGDNAKDFAQWLGYES